MEKTPLNNLDIDIYHKTLDNGFRYYIIPKNDINSFYVTLSTNYGSNNIEFVPDGSNKMIKVPPGIAHFLEHKMFENEDGIDPFELFDKNGASANANTSCDKTTYLFSGTSNFYENLNILLDYVYNPYFTDQNVEKEKGIIIQEINMCNDSFIKRGYNKILENSFIKNSIRIPVIGNKESVNSITKEDLYKCYNTFYNPSNMFLIITGNVDMDKTSKIIEEKMNQGKKIKPIKIKKYKEPDKVKKKSESFTMNVAIPKVYVAYKINTSNIDMKKKSLIRYLYIYLDSLFGGVSEFNEKLKNEKITNEGIDYYIIPTDSHILLMLSGETKKTNKLIKEIDNTIGSKISEEDFSRKKKNYISSLVYASDNIYSLNNMFMDYIIKDNEIDYDIYNQTKNMSIDVLNNILETVNFDNKTKLVIKPKK